MKPAFLFFFLFLFLSAYSQENTRIRKKDRKRDVEMVTTQGTIVLRLHNETPLHRDNFLRLVKSNYLDSILFHRVIAGFMIQAGDPNSRQAKAGQTLGNGGPSYTVPAEFHPDLFHHKGALAAAREGDQVNPERKSSGSQFYIVHGRKFTADQLDSIERTRLQGRRIPEVRRKYYIEEGGTPQLDGNYTVFGRVVSGQEVVDAIATAAVSQNPRDRPIEDVRILRVRLIKRK